MGKQMGNNNSKRPKIQNELAGKESKSERRDELLNTLQSKVDAASEEARRKYEEEKAKRLSRSTDDTESKATLSNFNNLGNNQTNANEDLANKKKEEGNIMATNPTKMMDDPNLGNAIDDLMEKSGVTQPEGEKSPAKEETVKTGSGKNVNNDFAAAREAGSLSQVLRKGNTGALRDSSASITPWLRKNIYLKQLLTASEFKHSFGMKKSFATTGSGAEKKTDRSKETIGVRINIEKPGTAKVAIVTMPAELAESFSNISKAADPQFFDDIQSIINNIQTNGSQGTVDVVMSFNDLKQRVATLLGGQIAEFGAITATGADTVKTSIAVETPKLFKLSKKKKPDNTFTPVISQEAVTNGKIMTAICADGLSHVMYQMPVPDEGALLSLTLNPDSPEARRVLTGEKFEGELTSEQKKLNQVMNFRSGKSPLKRLPGAFSPLYTERNYTPVSKFETVRVFSASATQEDIDAAMLRATGMLAKEALGTRTVKDSQTKTEKTEQYTVSYNDEKKDKVNSNGVLPVADKAVIGTERYSVFAHENLSAEDADLAKTGIGIDVDRTVRDFYTGECLYLDKVTQDKVTDVEFVKFKKTESQKNEQSPVITRYKAVKANLVCSKTGAPKEGEKTYGIDDPSVARLLQLTSQEVAEEAIARARKTVRSKSSSAVAPSDVVASMMSLYL